MYADAVTYGHGISGRKARKVLQRLANYLDQKELLAGVFRSRNFQPLMEYIAVTDQRIIGLQSDRIVLEYPRNQLLGMTAVGGVIEVPGTDIKIKLVHSTDTDPFNAALSWSGSDGIGNRAGNKLSDSDSVLPQQKENRAQAAVKYEAVDSAFLTGSFDTDVVGESNYVNHLRGLVHGHQPPLMASALLFHEPTNSYDTNAVQVVIGGGVVGYLRAELAEDYAPVLAQMHTNGLAPRVPAKVVWRTGQGEILPGVWLDLAPPHMVCPVNQSPVMDNALHLPSGNITKISQVDPQGTKEVIKRFTGNDYGKALVFAVLKATDGSNPTVAVEVEGVKVGETSQATAKHLLPQVLSCIERNEIPVTSAIVECLPGLAEVSVLAQRSQDLPVAWYNR